MQITLRTSTQGISITNTEKIQRFCDRFKLRAPILLAPMAGVSPTSLSIAVDCLKPSALTGNRVYV